MSEQKEDQRRNSNGCILGGLIAVAILMALVLGAAGGVMLEGQQRANVTIYPDIPAPVPETLNIVPSAQTFADTPPVFDPCADPSAPVDGWEVGVGGQLPPCWSSWSREQQNQFLRSH